MTTSNNGTSPSPLGSFVAARVAALQRVREARQAAPTSPHDLQVLQSVTSSGTSRTDGNSSDRQDPQSRARLGRARPEGRPASRENTGNGAWKGNIEESAEAAACAAVPDIEANEGEPRLDRAALKLPIDDFVRAVLVHFEELWAVRRKRTPRLEWRGFWDVAQLLKGHPELESQGAHDVFDLVLGIIRRDGLTMPSVGKMRLDDDDGVASFVGSWGKVRCPIGRDPLAIAFAAVGDEMIRVPGRHRSPDYGRFLLAACLLQLIRGPDQVPLSTEAIGGLYDRNRKTVGTWIDWGIEDGVLVCVQREVRPLGHRPGRAAEYRVAVHKHWDLVLACARLAGLRRETLGAEAFRSDFDSAVPVPRQGGQP